MATHRCVQEGCRRLTEQLKQRRFCRLLEALYTLARSKPPQLSAGGAGGGGGLTAEAADAALAFLTHNGTWLGMIAAGATATMEVRQRRFCAVFRCKTIILPRQTRDTRKDDCKRSDLLDALFRRCGRRRTSRTSAGRTLGVPHLRISSRAASWACNPWRQDTSTSKSTRSRRSWRGRRCRCLRQGGRSSCASIRPPACSMQVSRFRRAARPASASRLRPPRRCVENGRILRRFLLGQKRSFAQTGSGQHNMRLDYRGRFPQLDNPRAGGTSSVAGIPGDTAAAAAGVLTVDGAVVSGAVAEGRMLCAPTNLTR